ncbi:DUF4190 domain-containing protein [Desulfosarcina sp.]|nr:DUF4190 domain-containing protein [Desulfosarcina sp.]
MVDEIQTQSVPSQPVENKTSGKAIASLVLGIVSLFMGWIPIIGWTVVVLAIVFGFGALKQIKKNPELEGKGFAIAGIIMGFLIVVPSLLFVLIGSIAYFGVLNPAVLVPERCMMPAGLGCDDFALHKNGAASINFENGMGKSIQVNDIRILDPQTGSIKCATYTMSPVEIKNGGNANFEFNGCSFKDTGSLEKVNLEFDYYFTDSNNQFVNTVNGNLFAEIQ